MGQNYYSPVEEAQDFEYGGSVSQLPIRQNLTYDEPPQNKSNGYLRPDSRPPVPGLPPRRPTYGPSATSYDYEQEYPASSYGTRVATGPFLSATPVTPRQRSPSELLAPESAQQYSLYDHQAIREQQAQFAGRNRTASMPLREGDMREEPTQIDTSPGLRPSTAAGRKVPPRPPSRAKKPAPPPPAKRSYSGYP